MKAQSWKDLNIFKELAHQNKRKKTVYWYNEILIENILHLLMSHMEDYLNHKHLGNIQANGCIFVIIQIKLFWYVQNWTNETLFYTKT